MLFRSVVGTKLSSNLIDIVLKEGQTYLGKAEIAGEPYLCSYVPTKDANGQIDLEKRYCYDFR